MKGEVEVAVVGAGAAGLAAAVRLGEAGIDTLVLEARERIGGRSHTVMAGGLPLDLGCGWLHSADGNFFAGLAPDLGFAIDKTPPHWTRQSGAANFSPDDQRSFGRALAALDARVEAAADEGRDEPIADLIEADDRWAPLLDAFSAYYNGAEFDQISTQDYAAYADSEVNWRLPRGYGALIAIFGRSAPVMLETAVARIDHSGPYLRLETGRGTLRAEVAIVTVPTSLIVEGVLAFAPDLPAVREAAALPLGLADKVFLSVTEPQALPVEGHLFGSPDRTQTGSYHLRPFGRPIIEVYFGGRHAWALEAAGEGAAAAFAIDELAALLGSDFRARLSPLASSAWGADPWSRGAYSHALPGQAGARALLAEPIEERIFLAGEAASADAFSTAHGAALTGRAAAERAIALLRSARSR